MRVSAALWTHIKNETVVSRVRVACWLVPSWHDKFTQLEELRKVNRRLLDSKVSLQGQVADLKNDLDIKNESMNSLRDVIVVRNSQLRHYQDQLAKGLVGS